MRRIAYIILNYKTYQDTIKVTKEILSFEKKDDVIIIVDNASPNNSYKELSETFGAIDKVDIILSPENGGYAKGNNFGLRYAKKYNPEYVCIINNDVHFTWNTIDALIKIYPLLDKPALISPLQKMTDGSIAKFPDMKVPNLSYDIRMNSLLFHPGTHKYASNTNYPNVQRVGFVPGAFLFANYSVFEKLGFFDECTFLFCEERFTGKTVELAGLHNYLIMDLSYIHEHSKTISSEASQHRQRRMIHEGRLLYHKKYSRFPLFSTIILICSFYFHEFELRLLSLIK